MKKYCCLCMVLCLVLLSGCASYVMLHPRRAGERERNCPAIPESNGHAYEEISVRNGSGFMLHGWLFAGEEDYGTVLIGGGNTMVTSQTYDYNKYLINKGFRVLVGGYQGYGKNGGEADLGSMISDIKSFYDYVREKYPKEPVVFVGNSISTAGGICAASKYGIFKGLSLEGTLDPKQIPYSKVMKYPLYWPFLPISLALAMGVAHSVPEELNVADCISRLRDIPVLFIHHRKDGITPFYTAWELYEKYEGEKEFVESENRCSCSRKFHMNMKSDRESRQRQGAFIMRILAMP